MGIVREGGGRSAKKSKRKEPEYLIPREVEENAKCRRAPMFGWSVEDANIESEIDWIFTRSIKECFQAYNDGDCKAFLETLFNCFAFQMPVPRWCADAFIDMYGWVLFCKPRNWDDVFGPLYGKGAHRDAKIRELVNTGKVCKRIMQIREEKPTTPIDAALFEQVGQEFGIGKTLVQKYYYKRNHMLDNSLRKASITPTKF